MLVSDLIWRRIGFFVRSGGTFDDLSLTDGCVLFLSDQRIVGASSILPLCLDCVSVDFYLCSFFQKLRQKTDSEFFIRNPFSQLFSSRFKMFSYVKP